MKKKKITLIFGVIITVMTLSFFGAIAYEIIHQKNVRYNNQPEVRELLNSIEETKKKTKEIQDNIDKRKKELNSFLDDMSSRYNVAKGLIDDIYSLIDEKGDTKLIQLYIDTLNTLGFGIIITSFDEETYEISASKDYTEEIFEKLARARISSLN